MGVMETIEYIIYFKEKTNAYEEYGGEFITEDIDEANEIFEENKEQVEQYFSKKWILEDYEDDWKEDDVEVFYSDINKESEVD